MVSFAKAFDEERFKRLIALVIAVVTVISALTRSLTAVSNALSTSGISPRISND